MIRQMWKENPLWGENVTAGKLAKLEVLLHPSAIALLSQSSIGIGPSPTVARACFPIR
jgi:hypothetical protein